MIYYHGKVISKYSQRLDFFFLNSGLKEIHKPWCLQTKWLYLKMTIYYCFQKTYVHMFSHQIFSIISQLVGSKDNLENKLIIYVGVSELTLCFFSDNISFIK